MLALNAAVADQLMTFKAEVNERIEKGEPKERVLYLYYADGKWRRDEEDGFSCGEGVAALVLKNASEQIINTYLGTTGTSSAPKKGEGRLKEK